MSTYIGQKKLSSAYIGDKKISKIYLGNNLVYSSMLKFDPVLENNTWEQINKAAELGIAPDIWNVGDEKKETLSTGEEITLAIMGFYHDDLAEGGKAPITFGMKDVLNTMFSMNSSNTTSGGWGNTKMRTNTMETYFSQLPQDLQKVIKTVIKKTTAGNGKTNIVTSSDKLWLFSEVEIDNTTTDAYKGEGLQYEYWKSVKNGTTSAGRIKYNKDTAKSYWLRSPQTVLSTMFMIIASSGAIGARDANSSNGVSFGFCI